MSHILILLPDAGFDPTEAAVPWAAWQAAGHRISFASESGGAAACDPITLTGEGLPAIAQSLKARAPGHDAYAAMIADPAYWGASRWAAIDPAGYDALLLPGGHAPAMRPYIESAQVQRIARHFMERGAPVAAICHGVLVLARAGLLHGRTTTCLTAPMENIAVALTRHKLGRHYRTYDETVEAEVKRAVAPGGEYRRGPLVPAYATTAKPDIGFVVADGYYFSARWPGDALTLARRVAEVLG